MTYPLPRQKFEVDDYFPVPRFYSSLEGISKIHVNIPIRSHLFQSCFSTNKIFHWMGGSNHFPEIAKTHYKVWVKRTEDVMCCQKFESDFGSVYIYIYV